MTIRVRAPARALLRELEIADRPVAAWEVEPRQRLACLRVLERAGLVMCAFGEYFLPTPAGRAAITGIDLPQHKVDEMIACETREKRLGR